MDKPQIIGKVKKLVGEGELEQAAQELVMGLAKEPLYEALSQAAIQAQSLLQRTKKDEALGIISFDNARLNYNQVTHQILTIVDHWEDGKTSLDPAPGVTSIKKNRIWLYAGIGVLIVIIAGIFIFQSINNKPDVAQNVDDCPQYNVASPFNVLLFRFLAFGGTKVKTHEAIRQRLGALKDSYNLKMDIGTYNDRDDDQILPDNNEEASKIAEGCKAKLVIYGTEESQGEGKNIITTRYKFLDLGEQFQFTKLRINERTEVDTVTSISSIATSGVVTGTLEQNILKILLGVVALETNQTDTAIMLLKGAAPVDSASFMLRNMVLAEAFIKNDNPDEALMIYNEVLSEHPRYNFALENRAALLYKQGDYVAAVQDYNTRLENSPGDISTLTQRGAAHLKADNLEEARQDLEKVQKEKPQDTAIVRQLNIVRQKLEEKRDMKEKADERLRVNPKDPKALNNKAEANKSLGNYEESINTAEQLIRQDPKNVQAYTTLIGIYAALNMPEKAEAVKKRLLRNASKAKVIREAPEIREFIKRDSISSFRKQ